jgi:hypothetical protein
MKSLASIAVYTRNNPAHGWKFEQVTNLQFAEMARAVNTTFGFDTLLVPVNSVSSIPKFLDSCQIQEDIKY